MNALRESRLGEVAQAKEPLVAQRLSSLNNSVDQLEGQISRLDERLMVVSGNYPPTKSVDNVPEAPECPIANSIRSTTRRIEDLTEKLRHMMSSLEI